MALVGSVTGNKGTLTGTDSTTGGCGESGRALAAVEPLSRQTQHGCVDATKAAVGNKQGRLPLHRPWTGCGPVKHDPSL